MDNLKITFVDPNPQQVTEKYISIVLANAILNQIKKDQQCNTKASKTA